VTLSLNSTGQEIEEEKEFKRLDGWADDPQNVLPVQEFYLFSSSFTSGVRIIRGTG
jgi:hypothetical protein